MANKSKDPTKRKFTEDAQYTDTVLSVRVSAGLAARIDAAAKATAWDKSEVVRYAVVRFLVRLPHILQESMLAGKDSERLLIQSGFNQQPVSEEELAFMIAIDGEMKRAELSDLHKKVEKLEDMVKRLIAEAQGSRTRINTHDKGKEAPFRDPYP